MCVCYHDDELGNLNFIKNNKGSYLGLLKQVNQFKIWKEV